MLSAQRVCELYPDGKRVEDAFLLTKRLLGLAYILGRRHQWCTNHYCRHLDFLCCSQSIMY